MSLEKARRPWPLSLICIYKREKRGQRLAASPPMMTDMAAQNMALAAGLQYRLGTASSHTSVGLAVGTSGKTYTSRVQIRFGG